MGNSKKMVTIKDIAEIANVSIGTVDRAIHNRGRVATSTKLKIEKIIKEVGYKPNMFASRLSRAKHFSFAVLMPRMNQDNKFWKSSVHGIEKAEKELHHYHVKILYFFYDRYSVSNFHSVCSKILKEDIDGILIAPVLYKPVLEFIEKLPPSIPYVLFNTDIPELHPLAFIGQDSFQSGFVCGKLMKLMTHSPGTIAVVLTLQNDIHIRRRATGFRKFFQNIPDYTLRDYEIYNFKDKSVYLHLINKVFQENSDLCGIFVTNVSVHYFAQYVKEKAKKRKIFIIGYDLIKKNIEFLEQGTIDFLISQKPSKQGYDGIYTLYRHIVLRESPVTRIMMPIDIITKENVRYYLAK